MKVSKNYGSHLPVLVKAIYESKGPVLELGMGYFSSPVLHWLCADQGRELVSYETEKEFLWTFRDFATLTHRLERVTDWSKIDTEKPWGLAFIDQHPGEQRKEDARRLASWARLVVLHDTEGRLDKYYHYSEIYPLYKYSFYYHKFRPHTTVLSNFVDVTNWKC